MINIISVGAGAFAGAVIRYGLTRALPADFPFATLLSNIIAALLIGFIIGLERNTGALSEQTKLLLTTGLLGGLSTFSAFSMETITMIEAGKYAQAGANVVLNVGLCLVCVAAGLFAANRLFGKGA